MCYEKYTNILLDYSNEVLEQEVLNMCVVNATCIRPRTNLKPNIRLASIERVSKTKLTHSLIPVAKKG
jgi:DNA repair protein RadC